MVYGSDVNEMGALRAVTRVILLLTDDPNAWMSSSRRRVRQRGSSMSGEQGEAGDKHVMSENGIHNGQQRGIAQAILR